MKGVSMDKKTFEESLMRMFPECGGEVVQGWFVFADECIKMEQSPDFAPVSDKDATVEKWLDAIYKGLCRAKQEYGTNPAELIREQFYHLVWQNCFLSILSIKGSFPITNIVFVFEML
jgi:hypothetical protein